MKSLESEVVVIGAGPYGLSIAAHLAESNISTRVFGETMSFWRHMAKGMKLRSSPTATDLADPRGDLSFQNFAARQAIRPTWPLPLETFISYGEWFKENAVPEIDNRRIERIDSAGDGFSLRLDDGDCVFSKRVVVAVGLANQEFRPAAFSELPREFVSHACEHIDMSIFRGKRVAVVGRGQSACEYAALLNASGADVELVSRGEIHWLGSERSSDRPDDLTSRLQRILATKSGVGPFPLNWLAELPEAVRWMPHNLRETFTARCLRPGATSWLKPDFAGVRIGPPRSIVGTRLHKSSISLQFDNGSAEYEHVLLATGYRSDIGKLNLLAPELANRVRCVDGSPSLSRGFQSSVPGLHFVGSSSVMSYGPLMRFVAGSGYAARHLTQYLCSKRTSRPGSRARRRVFLNAQIDARRSPGKAKGVFAR
jgi:hypothetical protein